MKNFLNDGLIQLKKDSYLNFLIILAPLLNFMSGMTFDLYTPSMPAMANYYATSFAAVKNTITATLFGFGVGCFIFGILLDVFGRRRIILLGLFFYIITSFLSIYCQTIEQLIFIRFLQGVFVSVASVGSRAIVIDSFTGDRFNIALLYTSIAYGLAPIIAPFFGGILQYHFGWKANFLIGGFVAITLTLFFAAYINESIPKRLPFSREQFFSHYKIFFRHPVFVTGIFIAGVSNVLLMLYATVGAFIVENTLHRTSMTYGNTALLIGSSYLLGTLTNRFVIKKFHLHQLTYFGFIILIIGMLFEWGLAAFAPLNLFTLITPIIIICYSQGFIFPNALAHSLRIFPNHAGISIATFLMSVCMITSLGLFFVSYINISGLKSLTAIFTIFIILQTTAFYLCFKPK